jgi:hypothetical protein
MEQRLREARNVTPTAHLNAGCPWTVRTPANEGEVIAAVEQQTWRNSRDIAWEFGLSKRGSSKYFIFFFYFNLTANLQST